MATRSKIAKRVAESISLDQTKTVADLLRDDVIKLKQDRILHVAAALFYENGYTQTSVDAIVERLGATKPFFYNHFQSKTDLLVEICVRATADTLIETEASVKQAGTVTDRFQSFMLGFTRSALKNHDLVAIYFREEFNLPDETKTRINSMRKVISKRLITLLNDGKTTGEFDVDDSRVAAQLIVGMPSYAFAWYRENGRLGIDLLVDQILKMALKVVKPQ